jgi:hypothetical protein
MSSCWKCERTLPDGQVECEYGCPVNGQPKKLPTFAAAAAAADEPRYLAIELGLDRQKIQNTEAFNAAMAKFSELLGHALADSGLHEFIARIK